jgi:hypothetical protein
MRELTTDQRNINDALVRQPDWKVIIWDMLTSGAPSMAEVIGGTADTTHPTYMLDVTSWVPSVKIDFPGDRRAAKCNIQLVDRKDQFNPHGGANARFVKEWNVMRVQEGDTDLAESLWIYTFTGHIRGQAGFSIDRGTLRREVDISAYGRRATPKYNKMVFTSANFGRSLDYGTIISDIILQQMGMAGGEFSRVDSVFGRGTQFNSNQIVDMTPLEAIDKILEALGQVSDFDGEGIMRTYSRDVTRLPDKTYDNLGLVQSISIPQTDTDTYNSVNIIGLDKNLSEVETEDQELARANIPVGFWKPRHKVSVQWSKDRSVRAKDTVMEIIVTVNEHLLLKVGTETYSQDSDFGGTIFVDISKYIATLIFAITVTMALGALLGDVSVFSGSVNISLGKILWNLTMKLIFMTLSLQSAGEYLIKGTILTPVYEEFAVKMTETNIPDFLLNEKEIKNDFINELNHAIDIAQIELLFEHATGESRKYVVINDWEIEIGDIVFLPYGGGLRIWVDSFSKTLSRGSVPLMDINGLRAL